MDPLDWAPAGVDVEQPTAARVYDYLLGGAHNFAADRAVAEQLIAAIPDIRTHALANRSFLRRAVRFCVASGIRQFLDIGSGVPTLGNVHEVARQAAPESRVVYVDLDPVAVEHGRAILVGDPAATVIQADLRDPERILADPPLRQVLDLTRPVALLLVAILHAIPDQDDPYAIVARLRDALAPGSMLVVGHATQEGRPDVGRRLEELSRRTATPITNRTRAQVTRFFDGFELVEPGLVWVPQWRPDSTDAVDEHPEWSSNYGGVGRRA
jgi:SAM-dependent methyltransferase